MIKFQYTYSVICLFIVCFIFQNKLFSQTYSFNPGKTFETYVDTNENNFGGIEVINTGALSLDLTWRRQLIDTLNGCFFDICNSGICLIGTPFNGEMPTIVPGDFGWIKFHVYSGKASGTNIVKYVLKNGLIQSDTLTYIIHVVAGITSVKELKNTKDKAVLYPNPSVNEVTLSIDLESPSSINLVITNNIGQIVAINNNEKLQAGQQKIKINTSDYASGVYSVLILTNNGVINQKLVVSK
jgi:hypothetical protein